MKQTNFDVSETFVSTNEEIRRQLVEAKIARYLKVQLVQYGYRENQFPCTSYRTTIPT